MALLPAPGYIPHKVQLPAVKVQQDTVEEIQLPAVKVQPPAVKYKQITFRVSEETYIRWKKTAKDDDRTLKAWLTRRIDGI